MGEGSRVIAIGATTRGVPALSRIVRDLPPDLRAPVPVALHLSPTSPSPLPRILGRAGPLQARHGAPLEPGVGLRQAALRDRVERADASALARPQPGLAAAMQAHSPRARQAAGP